MEAPHLIPASQFCTHYHVDVSFLHALQEYGLVQVTIIDENAFIDADAVSDMERMLHLHQELHINLEGIDAILQLLKRLEQTQAELAQLRKALRFYEGA